MRAKGTKTIAENRKARHEYFVLETYEAGMELVGTEVKSIRQGTVNLKDAWCSIEKECIFLLMKRAIYLIEIQCGSESFSCINAK